MTSQVGLTLLSTWLSGLAMSTESRIRFVLSIDGGGIRGLIPALVLARLSDLMEETAREAGTQAPPLAHAFDLITGASTGGIIAIGLSARSKPGFDTPLLTPRELVAFYRERSATMFPRVRLHNWRRLIAVAYDHKPLEEIFAEILQGRRLSEAVTSLILYAYDIGIRKPRYFKNRKDLQPAEDEDFYLADVARAITAAPTFFAPAMIASLGSDRKAYCIDGAVFANNPALIGYIEAHKLFNAEDRIVIVSVGAGHANRRYAVHDTMRWGFLPWINPLQRAPLLDMMIDGQCDSVDHHLAELLGRDTDYFRFDAPLPLQCAAMDNNCKRNIDDLEDIAASLIAERDYTLRRVARLLIAEASCKRGLAEAPAPSTGPVGTKSSQLPGDADYF